MKSKVKNNGWGISFRVCNKSNEEENGVIMELKPWEIWDAEEREIRILREVLEILEKEDDGDFASAKLEKGICRIYEKISELKHEVWEKRKKCKEDEDVVALEQIICSLKTGLRKLESYYKNEQDEKRKRTLEKGIQTLERAVVLVRCQLQKRVIAKELKVMDDSAFLHLLPKCTLSVLREESNYDKFSGVSMTPIIEKTEREEREEFKKTLDCYTHDNLEEVWSKLRKVFDTCKDDCKRQGILIALKILEEKMSELELEIWGKELESYKTKIR